MKKANAFWMVFGVVALMLAANGQAQQWSATLSKQCSGDPNKDDPTVCGHSRMLRQGGNVYAVFQAHAAKKLELVEKAFADPGADKAQLLIRFKKDGTCLQADINKGGDKGAEICVQRLKRQAADAALAARNELVRQNTGRKELLDDKGGVLVDPDKKLGSAGGKNDTVMKDFVEEAQIDPKTQALRLMAVPRAVNFNGPSVGATLGAGGNVVKTTSTDINTINAEVAATGSAERNVFDTAAGEGQLDTGLTEKSKKAAKLLQRDIGQDQKDTAADADADAKARSRGGPPDINSSSVSAEAFKSVIDGLGNDPTKPPPPVPKKFDTTDDLAVNVTNDPKAKAAKPGEPKQEPNAIDTRLKDLDPADLANKP